jgi:hypothetical protein
MTLRSCPRRNELIDLLSQGAWPQAAPEELAGHVAGCPACRAEAELVTGLHRLRAQSVAQPHLPTASQIWWRAQLRRRREAGERLQRPFFGAQLFALTVLLAAATGLLVWLEATTKSLAGWPAELAQALHLGALLPEPLSHSGMAWLPVLAVVAAAAAASSLAYYAIARR